MVSAPNAYSLGKIKDTPVYSLASRPKEPKKYVTPAPGAYEVSEINQYKSKAPAFSLSTRYNVPSDTSLKPGPGAYTPEKVRYPEHSFVVSNSWKNEVIVAKNILAHFSLSLWLA